MDVAEISSTSDRLIGRRDQYSVRIKRLGGSRLDRLYTFKAMEYGLNRPFQYTWMEYFPQFRRYGI